MTAGTAWLLAGVVACGAEMVLPGVFLLWIGLAACGTGGLVALVQPPFPAQVASFAVLLAALLAVPLLRRRSRAPAVPVEDMLGRPCRATAWEGPAGRVRLGDGSWAARTRDGRAPALGAALRVVGREGNTLVVVPDEPVSGAPG